MAENEPHEHHHEREPMMIPAIDYRRPDELSDYSLMQLIDLVAAQHSERGMEAERLVKLRAALYLAIDQPSSAAWDRVFQLPVWSEETDAAPVQLWSLVVHYAGFELTEHLLDEPWPVVPSGTQIFWALSEHFGPRKVIDPRELF